MNWELRNLMCDIEIVKEKIDDVVTSFSWYDDEHFRHDADHDLTKEEVLLHGSKYHEHRIQNVQTIDLMTMYLKAFDTLIKKFHEIEKASSENFGEGSDNA